MEAELYKLRGYIEAQVVGMRYVMDQNHPKPALSDVLALCREPSNPYDANAILVLNPKLNSAKVGYLGRDYAAILAPILDCGAAIARALVSVNPNPSQSAIPCQVLLFSVLELTHGIQLCDTSSKSFVLYPRGSGWNLRDFDEIVASFAQSGPQDSSAVPPDLEETAAPTRRTTREEEETPEIATLEDAINYLSKPLDPTLEEISLLEVASIIGIKFPRPDWWSSDEANLGEMLGTSGNAPQGRLHEVTTSRSNCKDKSQS